MIKAASSALLMVALLSFPARIFSQAASSGCSTRLDCIYEKQIDQLMADAKTDHALSGQKSQDDLEQIVVIERTPDMILRAFAAQAAFDNAVSDFEQSRVDKQIGPTATTSGTTELVSRPSTSELLGLAVQLGALTQTVSGNTATFQANGDGLFRALMGTPIACLDCSSTPVLKNLNFSASFDLAQQSSKIVSTAGPATPATPALSNVVLPESSRQLSTFTARYNIYNPLDPRSSQFKQGWATAYANHAADLKAAAKDLLDQVNNVLQGIVADKGYTDLRDTYAAKIKADAGKQNRNAVVQDLTEYLDKLTDIFRAKIPDFDQKISLAVISLTKYSQLNHDVVQEARGKPQFTFEYTFDRPAGQPDTHNFRLILGLTPFHGNALLSLNAAGSLYGNSIPAGASYGRIKDFQVAAQFDRAMGDTISHPVTLSLAAYVQYQFDPSVLNIGPGNLAPGTNITLPADAQVLLGTQGTLAILQAKTTINLKSGVNIPVGVSWANKTELLNATDVRGHIGITYDFDSITQLFGGGKP
jgi:hypothetical protein